MDAGATASCGAVLSNAPIPILVLNPTLSSTLTGNGTIGLKIVGGPQRSIQVNSTNAQAVSISGASGSIDLSQGGPQSNGSDIGVTAIETQAATNATVSWGTLPGSWLDPRPAISDPFATIPAPGVPTFTTPAVIYGDTSTNFGCPDLVEGCDHY